MVLKVAGYRLGDQDSHSALDAEVAAIMLALHLLDTLSEANNATIFSDSQIAIKGVQGVTIGVAQWMLKSARRSLKKARNKEDDTKVRLQWCPGHSGTAGHDLADAEAKLAACGKHYSETLIPKALLLQHPLINPEVFKRTIKTRNLITATSFWQNTPAGIKFHQRFALLSPSNFLTHIQSLPRSRTVLLFRLITGHVQLNQHLHRIQSNNSPDCDFCEGSPETVAHFLLRCPHYAAERYIYLESAGLDPLSLDYLFYASEALLPLFDFLKATGRFKDTLR